MIKLHALKTTPKDPWGNPLTWSLKDGEAVVVSLGADGVSGGAGDDADLTSAEVDE